MPSSTLIVLIFLVAMLYASVGHGGASGYLAIMSLFAFAPSHMASNALMLNVLVAGTSCVMFWRAGYGSWPLLWPFLVGSVPAACIGGHVRVSSELYGLLLAAALLMAAVRLWLPTRHGVSGCARPDRFLAVCVGAGIGLISGIIGIGGGVFLSPLMILCGWADPKRTAAASAAFIVVNSIAGLASRVATGRLWIDSLFPLAAAACVGGVIGSQLGANRISGVSLRRLIAMALVVAAGKFL